MRQGEIRSLTGLRGVAALVVMAFHFAAMPPVAVQEAAAIGPGYLMVDLFFVLSGFVMARTYGAAFGAGMSWRHYRAFLEARFARVYPLYALVCLAVFLLTKLHVMASAPFPVRALAADIPMLENLGASWAGPGFAGYLDPPSWSISTELGAYLLFPALAAVTLHRSRRTALAVLGLCAGTVLWLALMPRAWRHQPFADDPLDISSGETLWPLARCLAEFCAGLLTYRATAGIAFPRRTIGDVLLVASLAAAWRLPQADVLIVALFPVLILQICQDSTPLARCLGSAVPYRLGAWSYAIYLLHWPALALLRPVEPRLQRLRLPHPHDMWLGIVAVLVVAAAGTLHRLVEKPARTLLRTYFVRPTRPIDSEPSAP